MSPGLPENRRRRIGPDELSLMTYCESINFVDNPKTVMLWILPRMGTTAHSHILWQPAGLTAIIPLGQPLPPVSEFVSLKIGADRDARLLAPAFGSICAR